MIPSAVFAFLLVLAVAAVAALYRRARAKAGRVLGYSRLARVAVLVGGAFMGSVATKMAGRIAEGSAKGAFLGGGGLLALVIAMVMVWGVFSAGVQLDQEGVVVLGVLGQRRVAWVDAKSVHFDERARCFILKTSSGHIRMPAFRAPVEAIIEELAARHGPQGR